MRKTTVKPTPVTTEVAPTLTIVEGKAVVSSLHIAQVFSKTHGHVLRDIEEVIKRCQAEFVESNFGLSSYLSEQNKSLPMYNLSRDAFTLVAMGFGGAKAFEFKIAYINAFSIMEKSLIELEGKGTGQSLHGNNSFKALINNDRDTWLKADIGFTDQDLELMGTTLTNFANRIDGVLSVERAAVFKEAFSDQYYQILSRSKDKLKLMTPSHRLAYSLGILVDHSFDQLSHINESLIKMGQKSV